MNLIQSHTSFTLFLLQVGEEMQLSNGFFVRPFPTTHTIASQGAMQLLFMFHSMLQNVVAHMWAWCS